MERDREAATRAVVDSGHPRRVIVAGPGTGKTTAFEAALVAALVAKGGNGLALTFLRTLADELEEKLKHCATGSTFHAYAKSMVHSLSPDGLTARFSLYPALPILEAEDLYLLGVGRYSPTPSRGDPEHGHERIARRLRPQAGHLPGPRWRRRLETPGEGCDLRSAPGGSRGPDEVCADALPSVAGKLPSARPSRLTAGTVIAGLRSELLSISSYWSVAGCESQR